MDKFDSTQEHFVHVRAEYEPAPIRAVSYQCPNCGNWFEAEDVCDNEKEIPQYKYQISRVHCQCPMCKENFGVKWWGMADIFKVEEVGEGEALKGVKKKIVTWE